MEVSRNREQTVVVFGTYEEYRIRLGFQKNSLYWNIDIETPESVRAITEKERVRIHDVVYGVLRYACRKSLLHNSDGFVECDETLKRIFDYRARFNRRELFGIVWNLFAERGALEAL